MFDRVEAFLGIDNLEKIKSKTILVVGIGGVGGYAVESLIRTGIQNIILIDHDVIDLTNLNRQIITSQSNVGMIKVDIFKERILSINPYCNVMTHQIFLDKNTINILNNYQIKHNQPLL